MDRLKVENIGSPPILKLINNIEQQNDAILDIINDFNDGVTNIAILLFFKNQFDSLETFLQMKKITHSKYSSDQDTFSTIENVHLTTFKSSKGLEFDVVIIPEFNSYIRLINNQKYNVTSKDFYVALTRAKRNLFLISDNDMNFDNSVLKVEKFDEQTSTFSARKDPIPENDDLPF